MVETDRLIALVREIFISLACHRKARVFVRQGAFINHPLACDQVRHMGIAKKRDPVGTKQACILKRIGKILLTLMRQAIHQIEVERGNTGIA